MGANTIENFEVNGSDPWHGTVQKWYRALEQAGIEFIDEGSKADDGGPGVRLRGMKR